MRYITCFNQANQTNYEASEVLDLVSLLCLLNIRL